MTNGFFTKTNQVLHNFDTENLIYKLTNFIYLFNRKSML